MGRASGGLNTFHWIRNNSLDFLRATSVKIAVENGKWKDLQQDDDGRETVEN